MTEMFVTCFDDFLVEHGVSDGEFRFLNGQTHIFTCVKDLGLRCIFSFETLFREGFSLVQPDSWHHSKNWLKLNAK